MAVLDLEKYKDKDFLTIEEVQTILRIGRDKARNLAKTADFPAIKIGASIRIPKDEFTSWYQTVCYSKKGYIKI